MVSIDVDLFVVLVQGGIFLFLLVALNFLLYKPIRGILRTRAEKLAQLNGDIKTSSDGVDAKHQEMERELAKARTAGAEVKDEQRAEARAEEQKIVEMATAEMEKAVQEVRTQIAEDIGKAREDLRSQVKSFGTDLAEKLLGRSIQ
jgi:F-type H+-transporting ATPase subunit b